LANLANQFPQEIAISSLRSTPALGACLLCAFTS
jgi:hypothetical protein